MTTFNNISQDFFDTINSYATNPIVLVVFILVILVYYILFAFIGGFQIAVMKIQAVVEWYYLKDFYGDYLY